MAGIPYEYKSARPTISHGYLYATVSGLLKDVPPGAVVFDAGCGNGSFLSRFRDRGWQLHGSDFSDAGIEIARKTFPDINFFLADAQTLYSDFLKSVGKVDVIISTEVIEHLYNPRAFLRNCHELLKPGGTLVITTPYHGYLKNLALALAGKMDWHFNVLRVHGHIKFFSRKTIEQILQETGFTDISFAGSGRLPYLWKSMVLKAKKA